MSFSHERDTEKVFVRDKHWQRQFVADTGLLPQPVFAVVDGDRIGDANLSDFLRRNPGAWILKPRFGSNGFCVTRIVVHPDGRMTLASDCPDTAQYLDEFPCDPDLRGGDLVTAITTRRERFADRARVGMSERQLNQSILEREIRQDRADGSMCEPRVVVQRTPSGFRTLGAICKRIDSPIGASVARDYREESLDVSLRRFFGDRFGHARDELFGTADRLREMLVPVLEASGTRVHQFGIDCRLCIDPRTGGAEFPFIEFQFANVSVPKSGDHFSELRSWWRLSPFAPRK